MKTNYQPTSTRNFRYPILYRWLTLVVLAAWALLFSTTLPVQAATCTWLDSDGNWNDSTKWSCGVVPGAGDTAVINNGRTVTLTAPVTIGTLELTLSTINGSSSLTVSGSMTWNGGAVAGTSPNDTLTIESGATLTISTFGAFLDNRTLDNHGAITFTSHMDLLNGSVFNNLNGATFTDDPGGVVSGSGAAPGVFNNSGTYTKNGSGLTIFKDNLSINNSGTIQINAGVVEFHNDGGGTHSGNFNVAAGAKLHVNKGTHTFTASSSLGGAGNFQVGGNQPTALLLGSFSLSGMTTIIDDGTADFELSSGSVVFSSVTLGVLGKLTGSNAMTVSGALVLDGGSILGASPVQTFDIAPTATVTINAFGGTIDNRTLNNHGAVTFLNTLHIDHGGVFNNMADGIFNDTSSPGFIQPNVGSGVFNNLGTYNKLSAGLTRLAFDIIFNNAGTVNLQAGELRFISGAQYNQTAGQTSLAGGLLACLDNPCVLNGGVLDGSGQIDGDVSNTGGVLSPGSPLGTITISNGSYTQGPGGTLAIELGGTTAGVDYDNMVVIGTPGSAVFDGSLDISLVNGFTPVLTETFQIADFVSHSGVFSTVHNPATEFSVVYNPTNVILQIVPPGLPALSISDAARLEGNSGDANLVFTVTLSTASASEVSVHFDTADGTAAAGSDYAASSDTLIIPAGSLSAVVTVTIHGDAQIEPDETFTVTLSNPVNATIAGGTATGLILNDDNPFKVFMPLVQSAPGY